MLGEQSASNGSAVSAFMPTCLIGNWQEDRSVLEHRLKDFVAKKEAGALSLTATAARRGAQSAPARLRSADPAGGPCYGDVLLVRSLCNGGVLALSLAEMPAALDGDHRKLHCAPPALAGESARAAFMLLSYEGKSGPVCYDDKVVFVSAGDFFGDEAVGVVHSEVPAVGSQASDQRVSLRVTRSMPYSAAFTILPADLEARLGARGQPVGPTDVFSFVHAQSGKRLAGLRTQARTDFGVEFVVAAQTILTKGAVHQLMGEQAGKRLLTGYGVKPEYRENHWCFVRADDGSAPTPGAGAPGPEMHDGAEHEEARAPTE